VNQHGIPLFARAHDGNESDKETLLETIQSLKKSFTFDPDVIFMGDSALYSEKNIQKLGHTKWITCVPATIKEMTNLLKSELTFIPTSDSRYSYCSLDSSYGGIKQKWVVVSSEDMKIREEKTFDKNIPKRFKSALNGLKKVTSIPYACETDANNALTRYLADTPLVSLVDSQIEVIHKRANGKRGRPKEGEALSTSFRIEASIQINNNVVQQERAFLGRFILATNVLVLDGETVLNHYKGQMVVEQGFRFLKDKSFRVAEVFLKTERRIEALCMVMVLCLMIYSYTERLMRIQLKKENVTVMDQKKRPTSNPTMKWIFFKFRGINTCFFSVNKQLTSSLHCLNDELRKILKILGPEYEKFYS